MLRIRQALECLEAPVHWEPLVAQDWVVRRRRGVQKECLPVAVESLKVCWVPVDCLLVLQCQVLERP